MCSFKELQVRVTERNRNKNVTQKKKPMYKWHKINAWVPLSSDIIPQNLKYTSL